MPDIRNRAAAGDVRQARTGKDAAIYNDRGTLIATMESFQSNVTYNNQAYTILGDPQEHETSDTYKVNVTCSQMVIEDDEFIQDLIASMETNQPPQWNIRGSLLGNNGSEQSVTYRDCLPSGQIDIQNFAVGQIVKRNWNFIVNRPPTLAALLTY